MRCSSNKVVKSDSKSCSSCRRVTRRQHATLYKQRHRPMPERSIKSPYSISKATSINSDCCRLPMASVLSSKADKSPPISFDQQTQVYQGHASCRNKENKNAEVHGGGGLELVKPARKPASSRPKSLCIREKMSHESCLFVAPCWPSRRKKQTVVKCRSFYFDTSRFAPLILAHRQGFSNPSPGSSTIELPSSLAQSGAYLPDRALLHPPRLSATAT